MQKPLPLGVALLCLLLSVSCGFQAQARFRFAFQADDGEALSCDSVLANNERVVDSITLSIFTRPGDSEPESTIALSCASSKEQVLVVDPGRHAFEVVGLNAEGVACYSDYREVTFGRRDDHVVDWTVVQDLAGEANGCVYP